MTYRELNKKILCILLAAFATQSLSGCSMDESSDEEVSQDSDFLGESEAGASEDSETADAEESSDGSDETSEEELADADEGATDEFADEESEVSENADGEKVADAESSDELDQELADAGGEEDLDKEFGEDSTSTVASNDKKDDFADAQQAPADSASPSDATAPSSNPPTDIAASESVIDPAPMESSPEQSQDLMAADATDTPSSDVAMSGGPRPLRKIESQPFMKNGQWMNAVYIGRPGDTVESISQKIYGADKASEITANNPWLSDGIKPGEKLYYNSPLRPADNATMLTYFEDKNIQPQTYTAQNGDNIRTISQNLLGFPEAWKEVWSVNSSVESKDSLPPGTELKYWKDDTTSAPMIQMAQNDVSAPPAVDTSMNTGTTPVAPAPADLNGMDSTLPAGDPLAQSMNTMPSGDVPQIAQQDLPAPSPLDNPADAQVAPPPAPATESQDLSSQSSSEGNSNDTLIWGGVVLVVIGGYAAMKIKKKGTPVNMEFTQV